MTLPSVASVTQAPPESLQPAFQSQGLPTRYASQGYPPQQQQYAPQLPPYYAHTQGYGPLPSLTTHDRRQSIPSMGMPIPTAMPPNAGPVNKRLAPPGAHPGESPAKKKQSKWSGEEDAAIIELRGNGMKWEDISKHLPGRSAISCRLRFQNYLERRSEWDDEKKNKLARLYERFKKDMWEKIAKEMQLPWRAAEAMHWQIGEVEMASRANVPVFHLAGSTSQSTSHSQQAQHQYYSTPQSGAHSGATTDGRSSSTSPRSAHGAYQQQATFPQTHSHTLPSLSRPLSPSQRHSTSPEGNSENRNRADSARDTNGSIHRGNLDVGRQHTQKRYVSPLAAKTSDSESS